MIVHIKDAKAMPQPRDLTGSIYKSKKLKLGASVSVSSDGSSKGPPPRFLQRRLGFSVFSFSVALIIGIAVIGQFFLVSLFRWL